jgi:hypothetical protein
LIVLSEVCRGVLGEEGEGISTNVGALDEEKNVGEAKDRDDDEEEESVEVRGKQGAHDDPRVDVDIVEFRHAELRRVPGSGVRMCSSQEICGLATPSWMVCAIPMTVNIEKRHFVPAKK